VELTRQAIKGKPLERMAIVHVAVPDSAREFEGLLRESLDCPDEILMMELSAGLSVHSGAGLVGVGVVIAE
jgi:fatty acid-binding protein DegV